MSCFRAGISDEELLIAYRTGDALSYQELYYRHRTHLFSFIENQVRSASLAEDISQEVWFGLILKIDHFCENQAPDTTRKSDNLYWNHSTPFLCTAICRTICEYV